MKNSIIKVLKLCIHFIFSVLFLLKDVICVPFMSASYQETTAIWGERWGLAYLGVSRTVAPRSEKLIHFPHSVQISSFRFLCCLMKGLEAFLTLCHFAQAHYSLGASVSSPGTKEERATVVFHNCGCLLESSDEGWKDTDAPAPPPNLSSLNIWGRIRASDIFLKTFQGGWHCAARLENLWMRCSLECLPDLTVVCPSWESPYPESFRE